MRRGRPEVWIEEDVADTLREEASFKYPLETGGVLLGYWVRPGWEAVILNVIGPGPKAVHERTWFKPDSEFHEREIARLFQETAGETLYLGDWHTHPDAAVPRPSPQDRRTVRRIAEELSAQAEQPLMLILGGAPTEWQTGAWVGSLWPRWSSMNGVIMRSAVLRIFRTAPHSPLT